MRMLSRARRSISRPFFVSAWAGHATGASTDCVQVLVGNFCGLQRIQVQEGSLLLRKKVLQARPFRGAEDRFVVHYTPAQLGAPHHSDLTAWATTGVRYEVLDVKHWEPRWILFEVLKRTAPCEDHPPAVDLEFDELCVGLAQQQIVADGAVPLIDEFEIVVVVNVLAA